MIIHLLLLIVTAGNVFAAYDKKLYGEYKVGKPYQIAGITYTPQEYKTLEEIGFISWYGAEFHAKSTSNGALFNKNTYTAAHRTLPMPSVIEVENLQNGKKAIIVVNDRGPFSPSQARILDVSELAAKELGFLNNGVTKARIKLLKKETELLTKGEKIHLGLVTSASLATKPTVAISSASNTPPISPSIPTLEKSENSSRLPVASTSNNIGGVIKSNHEFGYLPGYYVQVGAFKSRENAMKIFKSLQDYGIKDVKIRTQKDKDGQNIEIVRVGMFKTEEIVKKTLEKVKEVGYSESKIVFVSQ